MQKFKVQIVIDAEVIAPSRESAQALAMTGVCYSIALGNTVTNINVAAAPISGILKV